MTCRQFLATRFYEQTVGCWDDYELGNKEVGENFHAACLKVRNEDPGDVIIWATYTYIDVGA